MSNDELGRLFDKAVKVRDTGALAHALELFEAILSAHPTASIKHRSMVHNEAGYLCWKLGDATRARFHLQSTLQHYPYHELASLVLFHVFWGAGDYRSALEEAIRYCEDWYSAEYEELLPSKDLMSPTELELLEDVRDIIVRRRAHMNRN